MQKQIKRFDGELWWGGNIHHGAQMPFGGGNAYQADFTVDFAGNQCNPLFVSNKGRYIWSEQPYRIWFHDDVIAFEGAADSIVIGEGYQNLRQAYTFAANAFFPASGCLPEELLFSAPQYNTWIEMLYTPTQDKILAYAQELLDNGYPPGVLMIDDNWNRDYGVWEFRTEWFPDPKEMVHKLHELGFQVMLWVCPFVSPDSGVFRELEKQGCLICGADGETAVRKWWNGYSAVLDLTNPKTVDWFKGQLNHLRTEYGVDGFKFDAGDPEYYRADDKCHLPSDGAIQCEAWARIGLSYPLNEYRACWKMAGQPLAQRLRDKLHAWGGEGLASLIPNALAQGIAGYSFVCPDMIGGGDFASFPEGYSFDQELFVRYAQCAALFPMMQFSLAPWRVLDTRHAAICRRAMETHVQLSGEIVRLAKQSAKTGEPILRHLAYNYPDDGYERICDQFMLGNTILVAPVLEKGADSRTVVFPEGVWLGEDGSEEIGPCVKEISAPLERLPWYRRKESDGV